MLARERSEIGLFNVDSADKPDVCLFTITTYELRDVLYDPFLTPTQLNFFFQERLLMFHTAVVIANDTVTQPLHDVFALVRASVAIAGGR